MGQFVEQHEQRVPSHELRDHLTIGLGKTFEPRIFFERDGGGVDPRLKRSRLRGSRLRENPPRDERDGKKQGNQNVWSPEQARSHVYALWSVLPAGERATPPDAA
jgi:hypothetical protein